MAMIRSCHCHRTGVHANSGTGWSSDTPLSPLVSSPAEWVGGGAGRARHQVGSQLAAGEGGGRCGLAGPAGDIKAYLRQRKDTVRSIVLGLIDDSGTANDLADLLHRCQGLRCPTPPTVLRQTP